MEQPSPANDPAGQQPPVALPTPSSDSVAHHEESLFEPKGKGWLAAWERTPLYLRILGAVVLGLIVGVILGEHARPLEIPSRLVLRVLSALAPPLILMAVIQALMHAQIPKGSGFKLARLLVLNTLVAIFIGLLVANVVRPGKWAERPPEAEESGGKEAATAAPADNSKEKSEPKSVKSEGAESKPSPKATDESKTADSKPAPETTEENSKKAEDEAKSAAPADNSNEKSEPKSAKGEGAESKPSPKATDESKTVDAKSAPAATDEKSTKADAGQSDKKADDKDKAEKEKKPDTLTQFLDNVPKSVLGPLGDEGKMIGVILLAIALGIALRRYKTQKIETVADAVALAFNVLIVILHWVIAVIPLAVFCIVAKIVGTEGFGAFAKLGVFVVAVMIALVLQVTYYLVRIRFGSWVKPRDVIRDMRDALVMAFSTASSTVTMPVTYACLREKVGVRERSASLGALVGANFNNDGTALYEAMAALFVSQLFGMELSLTQQFIVVLTSVVASVGAAGIPEAGIVTMTLVFTAVGLPTTFIPVLLTVDWFLDRCRTTVNVLGDVNVSCLLDGKTRETSGG